MRCGGRDLLILGSACLGPFKFGKYWLQNYVLDNTKKLYLKLGQRLQKTRIHLGRVDALLLFLSRRKYLKGKMHEDVQKCLTFNIPVCSWTWNTKPSYRDSSLSYFSPLTLNSRSWFSFHLVTSKFIKFHTRDLILTQTWGP
jgi:hypothetical protein